MLQDVAAALGRVLCQRIGEPRYDLWFKNKTRLVVADDKLEVGVPNRFYQDWLQKTFAEDVAESALEVLGRKLPVVFVIDPKLFQAQRQEQAQVAPELPQPVAAPEHAPKRAKVKRWRKLNQFVVGPSNRMAFAAARHFGEEPDQSQCPLVVHGPVGTGKSHLLEGAFVELKRQFPEARILHLTAEEFTNRFLSAMHQGKLSTFRKSFRDCDGLLIDDLNFLSKKTATQEEFLHTLDALQRDQRWVMVTCDCHPRLADQFLPELADRLLGGAVCSLNLPDEATRLEILRAKAVDRGLEVSRDVLEFLTEHLRGNVRELEGALYSVAHLARVTDRPVDLELAREALGDLLRHSVRLVQLADVDQTVCTVLALDRGVLQSKKRGWQVSHPRMLAMYLARKHTSATYSEIGLHFGQRNHSTVVAAERKVRDWLKRDESLVMGTRPLRVKDVLQRLEQMLLG